MSQVKKGDKIKVHYTGTLKNGEVFDSSAGREPLAFTVGAGQMIPGFDNGVVGMELNKKQIIEIPAKEAYGEPHDGLLQEIPNDQIPKEIKPEVGMVLNAQTPDGRNQQLTVAEVKENSIVVDGNHPLAGKDLIFEVEVVEIG